MTRPHKKRILIQLLIAVIAAVFLTLGILRGEMAVVMNKAVNICMECIGLG